MGSLGEEGLPKTASVFHHSLVTSDSDALKFKAAASIQLGFGPHSGVAAPTDNHLITSPYNEEGHFLDLSTLDVPDQLLAKALSVLKPIRGDYATADYLDSFNWQTVIEVLKKLAATENYVWKERSFYVVTFRSRLLPTADGERLHALDSHSHEEATKSGGLLKYWFGTKDEQFQNLATCIWRSREDARLGGLGSWHKKARAAARELYASIVFTTLKWTIKDGAEDWEISEWKHEEK